MRYNTNCQKERNNTDNTFFNENSLMIKNNHSKEIIGSFGEINNKFSSEQLYGFSLLVDNS